MFVSPIFIKPEAGLSNGLGGRLGEHDLIEELIAHLTRRISLSFRLSKTICVPSDFASAHPA
jgi:hypothetical protein